MLTYYNPKETFLLAQKALPKRALRLSTILLGRSSERSSGILVNLAKCGIILFTLGEHYDRII
jgi:hypothetical protein